MIEVNIYTLGDLVGISVAFDDVTLKKFEYNIISTNHEKPFYSISLGSTPVCDHRLNERHFSRKKC